MKVSQLLEVWPFIGNVTLPAGDVFFRQYATYKTGDITFEFPDERSLEEAHHFATNLGLRSAILHVFSLEQTDFANIPGIYFAPESVYGLFQGDRVNLEVLESRDLAVDYDTNRIVASDKTRHLLGETRSISWSSLPRAARAGWSQLTIAKSLPDPIFIPTPLEMGHSEGIDDRYWVRSNGRDFLTKSNAAVLQQLGIAASDMGRTPTGAFSWDRRLVASGKVIEALIGANVKGLVRPLTPLLMEESDQIQQDA